MTEATNNSASDLLESEIVVLREALGLATTALPSMEMDVLDPIGMMHKVVAEIERLRVFKDALNRSPCTVLSCDGCGLPVVTPHLAHLPEGIVWCVKCVGREGK